MTKQKLIDFIFGIILGICLILFVFFASVLQATAQNVTLKGNVFVQDSTSHRFAKQNVTLTKYYYLTTEGVKYPIYMSASGKCFIIRTSKNGKQYKQYLKSVTDNINAMAKKRVLP